MLPIMGPRSMPAIPNSEGGLSPAELLVRMNLLDCSFTSKLVDWGMTILRRNKLIKQQLLKQEKKIRVLSKHVIRYKRHNYLLVA